jgi:hypothetical protein
MAFVSDRRHILARRGQALLPGARHLEQQDLFPLDPSHRRGFGRQPEPLLDLPVELQIAGPLGDPAEVPVHVREIVGGLVHYQRIAELLAELGAALEVGDPALVSVARSDGADPAQGIGRHVLGSEGLRLGEPFSA